MKIDFVIAWVNGNDPAWLREKQKYISQKKINSDSRDIRFRDWENLQFWFRGVEKYAPWVNKIYFVTWGHIPEWLNVSNEKLVIVKHSDFIPQNYLPTFNSHVIELNLHRIKGLSEHFVYFNDDMFLIKPVNESDFFRNGLPCDVFALDAIFFGPDSAGFYNGNDMVLINKNFDIRKQFKKFFYSKYLRMRYGLANIYRTMVLKHWPWFSGFRYYHIHSNFLKSTFEEVWDKEFQTLDDTCKDRFRSTTNVNQWLFKYWQLASGKFYPQKKGFGNVYHLNDYPCKEFLDDFKKNKYSVVCLNDVLKTHDWNKHKEKIIELFSKKLPDKCTFEK